MSLHDDEAAAIESETPLADWLARGQAWLAAVQVAGLASAGAPLCEAGREWADEGALLGWAAVARLMDAVLDPLAAPPARAEAWLDLTAWIATAQRLHGLPPP